jgi:hypothetical protein
MDGIFETAINILGDILGPIKPTFEIFKSGRYSLILDKISRFKCAAICFDTNKAGEGYNLVYVVTTPDAWTKGLGFYGYSDYTIKAGDKYGKEISTKYGNFKIDGKLTDVSEFEILRAEEFGTPFTRGYINLKTEKKGLLVYLPNDDDSYFDSNDNYIYEMLRNIAENIPML